MLSSEYRSVCRSAYILMFMYRINDLEQQLSAGLIEEVIQVAEGENRLIDTLYENKV